MKEITNVGRKTLSNSELLRERIEYCYSNYKKTTAKLNSNEIFEYAGHISAVNEVYTFMNCPGDWLDEEDAAYIMRFANPLEVLANEWQSYSLHFGWDIEGFIDDFIADSMCANVKQRSQQ